MEVKILEYVQFQYGYNNRNDIERSNLNEFKIYVSKNKVKDEVSYILYNNKLYEANYNEDTGIVRFNFNIYNEKDKKEIIDKYNEQIYKANRIEKIYIDFNLSNIGYVIKNEINIQSEENGVYIEPEIEIKNGKGIITYENKIIGRVNDARSITLLNAINKNKDIVVVRKNKLKIYTFRHITKDSENMKIKIFTDSEKEYKKIIRKIADGCRLKNNEVWLFLSEDVSDTTENAMILILPNKAWCKCVLDGNELKIKQVIQRPREIRQKNFLLKKNIRNIEFERLELSKNESNDTKDNDGFNDVVATRFKNNDFLDMIKHYEDTETSILEENKKNCPNIRYKSFDKDMFIIVDENLEHLEKWQNKLGTSICFKDRGKDKVIGNLKEVGDDYIKVDFKDDMIRNAIPRDSGTVGISVYGDEIIHKRRGKAIEILMNDSAAINDLAKILDGSKDFELFLYDRLLEKYEIGNLSDMQLEAVQGSLNTPEIFLIQGPPGAGKTTVIRKIVKKILDDKEEVLITSFQNLAVDNVLDGFLKSDVIPYRFGEEDNPVMQKICSEIADEINLSLKDNISKEKEEIVSKYRDDINNCRGKILSAKNENDLLEILKEITEIIKDYEGESSNYTSLKNILDDINKKSNENNISFDIDFIKNSLPDKFSFDLEIIDKIEDTQRYIEKANEKIESKTLERVVDKLKYLQEMDTIFNLEDKEYQKIKIWIFDELKLVKIDDGDEYSYFNTSIEIVNVLDEILDNIPSFIEDDKYNVIKDFHNKISNNPFLLEDILKKYPDIRGTTCQKTGGVKFNKATKGINYDYIIVDEAGRANPLDLLIPLIKGYKIILVGDHKQLPHMLEQHVEDRMKENGDFNQELYEKYIKESLFGRLFEQLPPDRKVMLDTQYRMTKEIGDLVSELFYDSKLKTGTDITNDTNFYTGKGLVSINVMGEQRNTRSKSWVNKKECEAIIEKLLELDEKSEGIDKKISVGVISFYKSQVELLKYRVEMIEFKNIHVEVGTVDAYQGLEKDIIFISSVRTDGIGFISNPNRLNVSLSRAKKLVVIFGYLQNLKKDKLIKRILDKCADGGDM